MPRRRRLSRRHIIASLVAAIAAFVVAVERHHLPFSSFQQEALPTNARIERVIDGDTVQLADGRHLRYIGLDTPEMRRHEGNQWIENPQPFAREAMAFNRRLVEGKAVRFEYDTQHFDKYNRLLAYVYLGDLMVNEELLRQGYAQLLTIPPDVRYVERFKTAASEARGAKRGLWGLPELPRRRTRRRQGG